MRGGLDFLFQYYSGDKGDEFLKALAGEIAERFLPPPQLHINSYFVAFADEFFGLLGAQFQIVASGFESDAEHFYFNMVLLRFVLPFFARLGVFELAEVHYFYDRRVGRWRDFNHVKPPFFGDAESVLKRDLAQVLAAFVNGPDARGAYLVVDAVSSNDKRVLFPIIIWICWEL